MTTFDPTGGRSQYEDFSNVTPIKPKLLPLAQRYISELRFAGEVGPVLDSDYVVKGWLNRDSISVVYGDANVGKSFWAIDIANHVQQGRAWGGCRTRQGAVLYIAAEGGKMFDNRLFAAGASFMVLQSPVTIGGRNCASAALSQMIKHLSEVHGPFALIIFDTLARVMHGDENSAPDIGSLVRSVDTIRRETGAHVMLIHHSGKDVAKGARGHSSLRAAMDTEITLSVGDTGERIARTTKQRDLPNGAEFVFNLNVVALGRDGDGDPVTSCTVKQMGGRY